MYFDPMYFVFALPALALAMYAQMKISSTYARYLKVQSGNRMTGLQVAERLLRVQGLGHVSIEGTPGQLTDHYDPRSKTLRLSPAVANGSSVAGLSIVAHEVGHAVQDATAYGPMKLRTGVVPMITVSAWLGPLIFMGGLLLGISSLSWVGLILFSGTAFFALITLPVELNASKRALAMLTTHGLIVNTDEQVGAKSVLDAAALTYIASLAQVLSTLFYYVMLLTGGSRRRR